MGLEADTAAFCLPEAQLAISGIQIARAIFDPLVVPDGDGRYSPYLAKSVEASDDFKAWTMSRHILSTTEASSPPRS